MSPSTPPRSKLARLLRAASTSTGAEAARGYQGLFTAMTRIASQVAQSGPAHPDIEEHVAHRLSRLAMLYRAADDREQARFTDALIRRHAEGAGLDARRKWGLAGTAKDDASLLGAPSDQPFGLELEDAKELVDTVLDELGLDASIFLPHPPELSASEMRRRRRWRKKARRTIAARIMAMGAKQDLGETASQLFLDVLRMETRGHGRHADLRARLRHDPTIADALERRARDPVAWLRASARELEIDLGVLLRAEAAARNAAELFRRHLARLG